MSAIAVAPSTLPEEGIDLNAALTQYREWLIEQAMWRTGGNKAQAARLLGLNRTTLVEMLKRDSDPSRQPTKGPGAPLDTAPLQERINAIIVDTVESVGGNITKAANLLGISRAKIYRCVGVSEAPSETTSDASTEPVAGHASPREESPAMVQPEPQPSLPEPRAVMPSEPPSAVHVRTKPAVVSTLPAFARISRKQVAELKAKGFGPRKIAAELCCHIYLVEKILRESDNPPLAKCGPRREGQP